MAEKEIYQGKVWRYGDNIDTDIIIAARYLNTFDPQELAKHCMADLDESFAQNVKAGDIMVGGKNFGCGSSREHAPLAILGAGMPVVIGHSFARIFYRNAINIGLAIVECPAAAEEISEGDTVEADLDNGIIRNITTGKEYKTAPFPDFVQKIIENGGLMQAIVNEAF